MNVDAKFEFESATVPHTHSAGTFETQCRWVNTLLDMRALS